MNIKDHYHYAGKYQGESHSICKLHYKENGSILFLDHKALPYDNHIMLSIIEEKNCDLLKSAKNLLIFELKK